MSDSSDSAASTVTAHDERVVKKTVAELRRFVATHGNAQAVVAPIGRAGVRIMLVGDDGVLGDEVVRDRGTAVAVLEQIEEISVVDEWEREMVAKADPAPGHYAKMAGWVARSSKFPSAGDE
ncbi:hypothetical protein [Millisia brevis]|uniref:hypothetical protein n=1 Tax=Millisia brevis TaxID=264148 RepID=UPI000836C307|nr:hypothetical protein [Millisia brevis]